MYFVSSNVYEKVYSYGSLNYSGPLKNVESGPIENVESAQK
jgi:hypothetical protein